MKLDKFRALLRLVRLMRTIKKFKATNLEWDIFGTPMTSEFLPTDETTMVKTTKRVASPSSQSRVFRRRWGALL